MAGAHQCHGPDMSIFAGHRSEPQVVLPSIPVEFYDHQILKKVEPGKSSFCKWTMTHDLYLLSGGTGQLRKGSIHTGWLGQRHLHKPAAARRSEQGLLGLLQPSGGPEGHPAVWTCFFVKSERNRRGPLKGSSLPQGLREQACPPAPSTHSLPCGAGQDVTVLPLGAPLSPSCRFGLPPPLPTPARSKSRCSQSKWQAGPQPGPPRWRSWVLSGDVGGFKEGLRV